MKYQGKDLKPLEAIIDGKRRILNPEAFSHGGVQYNTLGGATAHTFKTPPQPGQKFRTNGSDYQIIKEIN